MLKPDEVIEYGFAVLRNSEPSRGEGELVAESIRRDRVAMVKKSLVGAIGSIVFVGALIVLLKPTSALAALTESVRLSAAQPIVHLHIVNQDIARNPTSPPWPQSPDLDIWRFRDRYFRREGHVTTELFRDGRLLAFDDRFKEGYKGRYDPANDHFWRFDGTIGIEFNGQHKDPPVVKTVSSHGAEFTQYEWHDTDAMQNKMTDRVLVDPLSKLVRFGEGHRISSNGDVNHARSEVEYPDSAIAARKAPRFPADLRFLTKEGLVSDFKKRISHLDQSKSLAGIQTKLFGVLVYPNVPDGLGIDVITQGGAGPDYGSGNQPAVVGLPLLAAKRSDWLPTLGEPSHTRFGRIQEIDGHKYIVNQSNDLLLAAPKRITIRVPVWRLDHSTIVRDGKLVHPHIFVGFVTFTTSKIFYNVGNQGTNLYGHSQSAD